MRHWVEHHSDDSPDAHFEAPRAPSRRRWLLRLGVAVACVVVALAAIRWWWGVEARHRLDAEIVRLRAAGEPILAEDFNGPAVSDERNAAAAYREAARVLTLTAAQQELVHGPPHPKAMTDADRAELAAMVEANASALTWLREGRGRPEVNWKLDHSLPAMAMMLPDLAPQRTNGRFLAAAALHHGGRCEQACDLILDVLALARSFFQMNALISQLAAEGLINSCVISLEAILPSIPLDGARELRTNTTAHAPRLIAALLDEAWLRQALVRGLQTERMYQLDIILSWRPNASLPITLGQSMSTRDAVFRLAAGPLIEIEAVARIRHLDALIAAAGRTTWPEVIAALPRWSGTQTRGVIDRLSARSFMPNFESSFRPHFQTVVRLRMAAIAAAVRLYELEHGLRPRALADLVPDYFPEVPLDPFDGQGGEIRYDPDPRRPILYSIGPDGSDDGGRDGLEDRQSPPLREFDILFYLDGPPLRTGP